MYAFLKINCKINHFIICVYLKTNTTRKISKTGKNASLATRNFIQISNFTNNAKQHENNPKTHLYFRTTYPQLRPRKYSHTTEIHFEQPGKKTNATRRKRMHSHTDVTATREKFAVHRRR